MRIPTNRLAKPVMGMDTKETCSSADTSNVYAKANVGRDKSRPYAKTGITVTREQT